MKKTITVKFVAVLASLAVIAVGAVTVWKWVEREFLYPIKYNEIVTEYSELYSVDKALVYAVINCESRFDSNAVSKVGALGLMQITPETFQWLQTKDDGDEVLETEELYDPETNIKYGVLLLSLNLQEFGNTETALASYNAGRGVVTKWLSDPEISTDSVTLNTVPYTETAEYIKKVMKNYSVYTKRLAEE